MLIAGSAIMNMEQVQVTIIAFILIVTLLTRAYTLGECFQPTIFSVFAVNTVDGAQLVYKHSSSATAGTVLFEGHNISSSSSCGEKSQRCFVRLLSWDDITLAAVPLVDHFGLVTFNNDSAHNRFTFREKHVIATTDLNLDCYLTSIFDYPPLAPDSPTILAVCIHEAPSMTLLDIVFFTLNSTDLTASDQPYVITPPCPIANPSDFIFFVSPTFPGGVVVFVDRGTPVFQRTVNGESCELDDDLQVCSSVERFVPISSLHQAIYCSSRVYLLDLAGDLTFPTFSPAVDGVVMFCSSDIYCAYMENSLTLRQVSDKSLLQNSTEFPYKNNVVSGDCVVIDSEYSVVVQLSNSTVIAVNLNKNTTVDLGISTVPPQLFQHYVLLEDSTHRIVFDLQQSVIFDRVAGSFPLGAVINGASVPIECNISTESTTHVTPSPTTAGQVGFSLPQYAIIMSVGGPLILIIGAVAVFCCCCWGYCYWRRRQQRHILERNPLVADLVTPNDVRRHKAIASHINHEGYLGDEETVSPTQPEGGGVCVESGGGRGADGDGATTEGGRTAGGGGGASVDRGEGKALEGATGGRERSAVGGGRGEDIRGGAAGEGAVGRGGATGGGDVRRDVGSSSTAGTRDDDWFPEPVPDTGDSVLDRRDNNNKILWGNNYNNK